MNEEHGICPGCEAEGSVGGTCISRPCIADGMHFIPASIYKQLTSRGPTVLDGRIGTFIDEYLIVGLLGRGGFGMVYLALQWPVQMRTALKLLEHDETDETYAAQIASNFEREAVTLAALSHPNIVRLHKFGTQNNDHYLVMEYVARGRTLKHQIASLADADRMMQPKLAGHILTQVLNGLEAAHEQGIVHRDIKPDNIMLQEITGDANFVRLLDFGLAKFMRNDSRTSITVGTPVYMAPEQLVAEPIGPWTDYYAVGILAFELLTGMRPFPGSDSHLIIQQKLDPAYDATERIPDMPQYARLFFQKAIARVALDRYHSAGELRAAIQALVGEMARNRKPTLGTGDLKEIAVIDVEGLRPEPRAQVGQQDATAFFEPVTVTPPSRKPLWVGGALATALLVTLIALLSGGEPKPTPEFPPELHSSCAGKGPSCTTEGLAKEKAGDIIGAETLFENACEAGNARGCYHHGRRQLAALKRADSRDVTRVTQLLNTFEKACSGGHRLSCYRLGRTLSEGTITAKRPGKSAQWFRRGCDSGHQKSCYYLSHAYRDGVGVTKDPYRAKALLEEACEAKHPPACAELKEPVRGSP